MNFYLQNFFNFLNFKDYLKEGVGQKIIINFQTLLVFIFMLITMQLKIIIKAIQEIFLKITKHFLNLKYFKNLINFQIIFLLLSFIRCLNFMIKLMNEFKKNNLNNKLLLF